ncbi:ribosome assembly factor SBDS [Candidatus Pacearchaeota archaeon]|nr:ribosome assembly factor SBDS [Candidatus Pacearchaeota archaeon]
MTQTTARIKQSGKPFEIIVDMKEALAFRKGDNIAANFLEVDKIFTDAKKGDLASHDELEIAFGTDDINEISKTIVKKGEIQVNQEQRNAEQEKKVKQVVDFLSTNAIDPQTQNPITPERLKSAIKEAHINIKNVPLENQIQDIIEKLSPVIPIKIETKKVKVTIPAIYTGTAYGIINQYKEKEDWLDDGSLVVVVNVPSGVLMDFYDKLNSATHGAVLTEDIKEE